MREIIKAFFTTGSGSIISLILNVISIKTIAVLLGPSGVGIFSLLRQIRLTALAGATLSGQTALIQGGSSREGKYRTIYLRTILKVFLIGGFLTSIVLIIFAPEIASRVINQNDSSTILMVRLLAIPVFISVIVGYFGGVLTVYKEIGALAVVQVSIALTFAVLAYPVAKLVNSGEYLAFIGWMTLSQIIGLIISIIYLWQKDHLKRYSYLLEKIPWDSVRHFIQIAGPMSLTGLIGAGSLLAIRSIIIRYESLGAAGIFDAAWTLSMTYVMLILASFQTYYLPTLSRTQDEIDRNNLIRNILRLSLYIIVPVVVMIILMKPFIIKFLYSPEFIPALSIIRWMLIGDYFKVFGWVLAMPVIAYADMKVFLFTEILWYLGFLGISIFSITVQGSVVGIGISFMLLYFAYMVYMYIYTRTKYNFRLGTNLTIRWVIGFFLILIASWQTWHFTEVQWLGGIAWVAVLCVYSWLIVEKEDKKKIFKWGNEKLPMIFRENQ